MDGPTLSVRSYRRWTRLLSLLAIAFTTAGLYGLLHRQWTLGAIGIGAGVGYLYLNQRLLIQSEARAQDLLIFVTKQECALCEEARVMLDSLLVDLPLRVEERRIEDDRFLRRHFKEAVPVLLWQAEEVARLAWDAPALRKRLEEIAAARTATVPPTRQQSP